MKTFTLITLAGMMALSGCKKGEDTPVTPVSPTKPDYQVAIDAKYKALGWTQGADNGSVPQQTAGKKGYVQYYGSKDRAIYYFNGKAYGFLKNEMVKYDALGQDNFTGLGLPTSDGTGFATGISGNEFENGVIVTDPTGVFAVYGPIYAKYKAIDRWNSPLGYPDGDVTPTAANATDKGSYVTFKKGSVLGAIFYTPGTGAQAIWDKAYRMWIAVDWERSWLKFPTTSCDPTVTEGKQLVRFQGGVINALGSCGSYQNSVGETTYQNGTRAANSSAVPCYNP